MTVHKAASPPNPSESEDLNKAVLKVVHSANMLVRKQPTTVRNAMRAYLEPDEARARV